MEGAAESAPSPVHSLTEKLSQVEVPSGDSYQVREP